MRERFERLAEGLVILKLFDLSLIGSRFAVYEYDRASQELTPPEITRDFRILNDTTSWALARAKQSFRDCAVCRDSLRCPLNSMVSLVIFCISLQH